MYYFVFGNMEQIYVVPCRTIEDLMARIQVAMTKADSSMLKLFKRMPCGTLIEIDTGHLGHR
jgi:hypothetical protein